MGKDPLPPFIKTRYNAFTDYQRYEPLLLNKFSNHVETII